jgi:hypothetical protein
LRGKNDDNLEVGDWEGPRDRLDALGMRKMSSFAENITTIPQYPGRVLVTVPAAADKADEIKTNVRSDLKLSWWRKFISQSYEM